MNNTDNNAIIMTENQVFIARVKTDLEDDLNIKYSYEHSLKKEELLNGTIIKQSKYLDDLNLMSLLSLATEVSSDGVLPIFLIEKE